MQKMKNATQIIKHTNVASAACRQIIGGGGCAPIIKSRRRPQIVSFLLYVSEVFLLQSLPALLTYMYMYVIHVWFIKLIFSILLHVHISKASLQSFYTLFPHGPWL